MGTGTSDVTGLTTQELCENLPAGLDSSVWKAGSYTLKTDGRLRTTTMVYPGLIGVVEAYTAVKYEYDFNNDGTYLDCTLITTADEFAAIGNDETKWLGNYVLGEDIDLEGRTDITPIGGSKNAFTGKFSGNGHTISNVEIKKSTENYIGLFGRNGGLIADLHVENANVVGYSYVGGVCGLTSGESSQIDCCYSAGKITGNSSSAFGGIAGQNNNSETAITNCYYDNNASNHSAIGALDGSSSDDEANNVKGLTMAELCSGTLPTGFSSDWKAGETTYKTSGLYRTVTYTYPSLDGVSEPYSVEREEYNFGIEGKDDWQEYIEISTADEFVDIGNDRDSWNNNYVLTTDFDLKGRTDVSPIGRNFGEELVYFTGRFDGCGHNNALVEYCYSSGAVTVREAAVYDPVCFNQMGTSTFCYYNSELCGSGRLYGEDTTTSVGLTAQELCSALPAGLSDSIWKVGSYTVGQADGKLREDSYTYPSFKGRKAYSVENEKRYDFGIDGNHDWQIYTLITTAEDFADIGSDPANWAKNYVLGADIDLKDVAYVSIGTDLTNFTGRFSGDGYSFKNVSSPLFGVNSGIIEHLTIESGSIKYNGSTGSICRDNKGTIYCCGNNADVEAAESTEGTNNAGGIAANNAGGLISNCYNTGSVTAPGNAGGICIQNTGTIEYCYNAGLLSGTENADAVCYEQKGNRSNCYYDEMCGSSENGLGSTTWNMTYGTLGNLDKTIWVKKPNTIDSKTGESVAYYPSFSERFAPSVGFTVTQKFSVLGDEPFVYGDDIVFSANETMEFDTGFSMTNSLSAAYVEMDGEPIANGFNLGRATWKADTVGEKTFTLVHEYSYYNGAMTKDITVNIEKAELTAADFDFVPAADLVFNNKEKAVKITAKQGMEGVGAVTVKYFSGSEELNSVSVNVGDYTVKISVKEGDFYKAADLEDSAWAFTIAKSAAPSIPKIELSRNWKTDEDVTILVPGIPENLGEMIGYTTAPAEFNGKAPVYSDGRFSFHIGPYSEEKVDTTVEVSATISSQNYNDFDFVVAITLNNKANKEAPDPGDFDIVFTDNGNGLTAEIATSLEGVEYSFDGAYWSSENTLDVAHDEDVTAFIRYAQTDDMNASAPVSRQANSGHSTLTHHDRTDPDCTRTGTVEYWECEQCTRYFLDEECKTETTLEDVVLEITDHTEAPAVRENEVPATCTTDGSYDEVVYCAVCSTEITRKHMTISAEGHKWAEEFESDKTGHWHKCEVCSADSAVEAHVSGSAVIDLNGKTTVPADVIRAIANGGIKAELVVDSVKIWMIDGSKITAAAAADLSSLPGNADRSALRGISGADLKVTGTGVPADLKLKFRKEFAGQFANVYKLTDKGLVFQGCVKVGEDGSAVISGTNTAGEYVVMVCEFSDLSGDLNNDGALNALDASAILKDIVGILKGANPMMGDFNGDGTMNALDASAVLKRIVGAA